MSDFLSSPDAQRAIERFAATDELTVVVGAGVSAEARLPSWYQLISALLHDAVNRLGSPLSDDETTDWIEWILKTDGLPGAGTIVQTLLGKDFLDRLRHHLYLDSGAHPRPGPTANQIARLHETALGSIEVLTTNYDRLIETALVNRGISLSRIRSYVSMTQPSDRRLYVVRHLHGILTSAEAHGTIVLSDSDYFEMQAPRRWQEQHMRNRLEQSACLFLGTSLTDPNLARYIHRSAPGAHSAVVFTRQGDSLHMSSTPAVRRAHEQAAQVRWGEAGVEALYADYFSETAQFAYELSLRRECLSLGTRYRNYHDRIADWHNNMSESLLQTRDLEGFRDVQDSMQTLLEDLLSQVEHTVLAPAEIRREDDEKLGLHLWVHDPFDQTLVLWASSDRSWRDPTTLTPVPIRRPTEWVSVETFCTGTPMTRSTAHDASSRWNHVMAVPVRLDAEPSAVAAGKNRSGFLPVGVVTMASTRPENSSVLAQLDSDTREALNQLLAAVGGDILTPAARNNGTVNP